LAAAKKTEIHNYDNHVSFDLKIEKTTELSDVLALPYSLDGVSTLKGSIDEGSNKIDLVVNVPSLKSAKQKIDNLTLHINNPNQVLQLTSNAQLEGKNGLTNVSLVSSAAKDSVSSHLSWQDLTKLSAVGEIKAIAKFRKENSKMAATLSLLPTNIVISDSVWSIHPSTIDFNTDSTITIHDFRFDNKTQFIHVDGLASKNQKDVVAVDLNKVDLGFVLHNILKLKGITIGGIVTGKATLLSLLKQPVFEANLFVKDAQLNHKVIGDVQLFSTWDRPNQQCTSPVILSMIKTCQLLTQKECLCQKPIRSTLLSMPIN
jgi:hypothetical protein